MVNSTTKKIPKGNESKGAVNRGQAKANHVINESNKPINQRSKRVSKPNRLFLDDSIWKNDGDVECKVAVAKAKKPIIVGSCHVKSKIKRATEKASNKATASGESSKIKPILAKESIIGDCKVLVTVSGKKSPAFVGHVTAKIKPTTEKTSTQNQPIVTAESSKIVPILTKEPLTGNSKALATMSGKKGRKPFIRLRFEVDCTDLDGSVDLNDLVKFLKKNLEIDEKKNNSEKVEVTKHKSNVMILSKGNLKKKCIRDQTYKFLGRMNREFRVVSKNKRSYKIIKKS